MKAYVLASALLAALAALTPQALAFEARPYNTVTPYGDFCPYCTKYGAGAKEVRREEAVEAVRAYFHMKGLGIRGVKGEGRFIRVDIVRDGKVIDSIIFDRKSGRIRSTY
jgi:hypothetical protein